MSIKNIGQRYGILFFWVLGLLLRSNAQGPVKVIFDTDMGPDYDDVGAIAVLHSLADKGEAEILATMSCNHHYLTGPTIELLNTYFKRPGIPVGVPKLLAVSMGAPQQWPQLLMKNYPHRYQSNDELPDAVKLYRELLARAPDSSVTVIAVGFLTNLSDLLNTPPDKLSPLTGRELVQKKVQRLVTMAGRFPVGKEFNVIKDVPAATNVVAHWPTRIFFSGWEIGNEIRTGLKLVQNKKLAKSPVKDVFSLCIPMAPADAAGRMSWDQTAVLAGVRGENRYFDRVPGRMVMLEGGKNGWVHMPDGRHFYYVMKMAPEKLGAEIESLMMR